MTIRLALGAIALAAATALTTTVVLSQEKPPARTGEHDHPAPGAEMPMDPELMEKMMAMATPGEHHQKLNVFVGDWNQTVRFWIAPGTPATESKSTATYKWILGGRFLQGNYRGNVMGSPFEGYDILGYDNFRKEYFAAWMDNMTTAMMISRGQFDTSRNAIVMNGKADDCMTGERDKSFRSVTRIVDENTIVYEMFTSGPDGKEFRSLEVRSTRRK